METHSISAYNEENGSGLIRHIFIRTNYTGEVLVCLVSTKEKIPHLDQLIKAFENSDLNIVGLVQNIQNKNTNVIMGEKFNAI